MPRTTSGSHAATPSEIDELSVEQALADADIAIERSRDLTFRLMELSDQLDAQRAEISRLEGELALERERYEALTGNRAYRLAVRIWELRRALGV